MLGQIFQPHLRLGSNILPLFATSIPVRTCEAQLDQLRRTTLVRGNGWCFGKQSPPARLLLHADEAADKQRLFVGHLKAFR